MLTLRRKEDQFVWVGNDVKIVVLRVEGNRVLLGIEAPEKHRILRGPELVHPDGTPVEQSDQSS